jgi:putative membrane protein
MQIVRTIVWVLLLVAFIALTLLNWETQLAVRIWPGIVWDTRLPAVIVVAFLLGLIPMWLVHRGSKWRHQRRIMQLETSQRATADAIATPTAVPPPPSPAPLAPEPVRGAPVPRADILG